MSELKNHWENMGFSRANIKPWVRGHSPTITVRKNGNFIFNSGLLKEQPGKRFVEFYLSKDGTKLGIEFSEQKNQYSYRCSLNNNSAYTVSARSLAKQLPEWIKDERRVLEHAGDGRYILFMGESEPEDPRGQ